MRDDDSFPIIGLAEPRHFLTTRQPPRVPHAP